MSKVIPFPAQPNAPLLVPGAARHVCVGCGHALYATGKDYEPWADAYVVGTVTAVPYIHTRERCGRFQWEAAQAKAKLERRAARRAWIKRVWDGCRRRLLR